MASPTDALQPLGDGLGTADLTDQVDVADVDAELQGGGGDDGLQFPLLQLVLHIQPDVLAETAVVGLQVLDALLLELEGDVLRTATGVGEDQGGPMVSYHALQQVVHPGVYHLKGEGGHVPNRAEDSHVQALAGFDLHHLHRSELTIIVAGQVLRHLLHGGYGGGEANADEATTHLLPEPLKAEG